MFTRGSREQVFFGSLTSSLYLALVRKILRRPCFCGIHIWKCVGVQVCHQWPFESASHNWLRAGGEAFVALVFMSTMCLAIDSAEESQFGPQEFDVLLISAFLMLVRKPLFFLKTMHAQNA